jgi:hypothetical protein
VVVATLLEGGGGGVLGVEGCQTGEEEEGAHDGERGWVGGCYLLSVIRDP